MRAQAWSFEVDDKEIVIYAPVAVWVDYDDVDRREAMGVARLIAAAPELLALAKQYASECAVCDGRGFRGPGYVKNGIVKIPSCKACAPIRAVIAKCES